MPYGSYKLISTSSGWFLYKDGWLFYSRRDPILRRKMKIAPNTGIEKIPSKGWEYSVPSGNHKIRITYISYLIIINYIHRITGTGLHWFEDPLLEVVEFSPTHPATVAVCVLLLVFLPPVVWLLYLKFYRKKDLLEYMCEIRDSIRLFFRGVIGAVI